MSYRALVNVVYVVSAVFSGFCAVGAYSLGLEEGRRHPTTSSYQVIVGPCTEARYIHEDDACVRCFELGPITEGTTGWQR